MSSLRQLFSGTMLKNYPSQKQAKLKKKNLNKGEIIQKLNIALQLGIRSLATECTDTSAGLVKLLSNHPQRFSNGSPRDRFKKIKTQRLSQFS